MTNSIHALKFNDVSTDNLTSAFIENKTSYRKNKNRRMYENEIS